MFWSDSKIPVVDKKHGAKKHLSHFKKIKYKWLRFTVAVKVAFSVEATVAEDVTIKTAGKVEILFVVATVAQNDANPGP